MKSALVTGGGTRVGRAIVEHLAAHGYRVGLHYHRSETEALTVVAALGDSVCLLPADLSVEAEVPVLVDRAVTALGGLDLLVNSAAIFYPTRTLQAVQESWNDFHRLNLQAPMWLSLACVEALRARRGSIVNIADIYGRMPLPGYLPYAVAKAGLLALTQGLALELAPDIRVNAVAPGAILLPQGAPLERVEALVRNIPAGRLGQPSDIAEAVLYLAGAAYVTGQVLTVDGGRSLKF